MLPTGEFPLSLAASSNQLNIVLYLLDKADVRAQDSEGNTVLHVLVIIADKSTDKLTNNTKNLAEMYDIILIHHHKYDKSKKLKESEKTQLDCMSPLREESVHFLSAPNTDNDINYFKSETSKCQNSAEDKLNDLESIENNQGLTPLKLAAKLGRVGVSPLFILIVSCGLRYKAVCNSSSHF